jgi:uncharacterized protein
VRPSKICVFLFFLDLLFTASFCRAADAKTFLWKVNAQPEPLYLLGSIHVGNESLYPLPAAIEQAFRVSETLAVEVDITADEDLADNFAEAALYPTGDTLQKHISKETYRMIMKEFERYGVDPYRMQRIRPWALAWVISGLEGAKRV